MALDNQFRINELISSGSRAVVSKDTATGEHTFVYNSDQIVLGKSEGGTAPYTHIRGERDGEQTGRIEKPKYDEEQLKKAVDVEVDELIGAPRAPQPDVVPRPVYEDLRKLYEQALADLAQANIRISQLESQVQTLTSEIEALLVENDSLKVQRAAAENEAQVATQRYSDLLKDFSNAIIKGTRDGIERVSLKAQVEGLQAQKETLREQLKSLNLIISQLEQRIEEQEERQASESALDGQPGSFDEIGETGYKIPQGEFTKQDKQLYIETENDDRIVVLQGTGLNLYNFSKDSSTTFNISVDGKAKDFLEAPSSITLPAREGTTPGVGHITFKWKPLGRTSPRKSTTSGNLKITASSGESFSVKVDYKKEVRRKDRWSARGSARAVVGSEL